MKKILYLTDLYYKASGRNYYEEDLYITSRLKDHFAVLIGHPHQALDYIDAADLIVFRNTGPVMAYKEYFDHFVNEIHQRGILTINSFDGKADVKGKDYLLKLTTNKYPVIPTVERIDDISLLGDVNEYIVKLKDGADSIGMQKLERKDLVTAELPNKIIQPYIDFEHEISFYYLNNIFQYALYAPKKEKRWDLKEYNPSPTDFSFAELFIKWNNITRGITRVDCCRIKDGGLLLVELEDLNPFLSLDALNAKSKEQFIENFIKSLQESLSQ